MAQQNIRRSSSRGEPTESWPPLVCICNLCECGGHKCSDFNEWLAATRDGGSTTPLDDQQQQQFGGDGSSRMRPGGECCNAGALGHSCNYTRAGGPLDERFLTTATRTNHQASGQQQQQQENLQLRSKRSASQPDGAADEPAAGSVTPASKGRPVSRNGLEADEELLHVLVTRPQVASRPRDNIIFEGDMDLRTTFETSYEALARTRLEHWKRHQELKAAAGQRSPGTPAWRQDVSDTSGQRAETLAAAAATSRRQGGGLEGRPADEQGGRAWGQLGGDVDGAAIDASGSSGRQSLGPGRAHDESARNHRPASNATMIKPPSRFRSPVVDQSLQSKQERRPLVFGPALGLERANGDMADGSQQRQAAGTTSPSQAAALTTGQRKQQQHRRQQDHFIDPDLSPIIVYDANLNRLERVGLRKRSKYRPSTSLRPGGGGFFGPEERDNRPGPEMATATRQDPMAEQINVGDDRSRDERRPEERGANPSELDGAPSAMEAPDGSAPPAANGSSHQPGTTTTARAAGASSETLNRAQVDCGRKHHLGHVNRIDHIRQLNLVESSPSSELAAANSIAMANNGGDTGTQVGGQQLGANDEDEQRRLALEEEAAVAEIQRLVVGDGEYRVAHRIEPPPAMRSSSRQSNRLIKQATIASPSEAAARAQANSPASNQAGGGRSSSRQLRMERVCQNQSFYLFENDYPETRNGALDDKRCIKIGGRETVELTPRQRQHVASPQSAHVRQNLFRESPDFIMTTGRGGKRVSLQTTDEDEHQQPDQQQQEQHQMQNAQNGSPGPDQAPVQEQHENIKVNQASDQSVNRRGDSPSDPHQCRVLNLGHDFEFVGSRAGHRYFVEKHIMATPISELS